jgi:hypothetical protein
MDGDADSAAVRRFLQTFGPELGTSKKRATNTRTPCSLITFKVAAAAQLAASAFFFKCCPQSGNMKIFSEHHGNAGKDGSDFFSQGKPKWTIAFQNVQASPFLPLFLPTASSFISLHKCIM